ncbi:MAG: UDP-glucose 4-epimerase GalE [Oscillospiraceae bacterium]|nr:UDP-glucose 4-epimerase GalE [Oscillospiraceae bacterium]
MNVLVTGGAGYIGSTIASALLDAGHTPIVLDNLLTGREEFTEGRIFYKGDIADRGLIEAIFEKHSPIYCAIHCAAMALVPESVAKPYEYYRENVAKSVELFKLLSDLGCSRMVFSSSASLYDDVEGFKVTEDSPLKARSPYARTKLMMEMVLQDMCAAYDMRAISLRYFNPIGADPKLRSGNPGKNSTLVLGKLIAAATGSEDGFCITGTDWPTRDGTGIRDYVHVWDLAQAHICAVEKFDSVMEDAAVSSGYLVINLGLGNGVTVREIVEAFKSVHTDPFIVEEGPARPGDVAGAYASNERAKKLLGWSAQLTIEDGIRDALRWDALKVLKDGL